MPLPIGTLLPSLDDATDWLTGPVERETLRGKPVIIQFWAISCPLCKMNLPHLQKLLQTYQNTGLALVSVHMPRGEADMNVEKVKAAVEELALAGPCAIDNTHALGDRFETGGLWPCYLLFDADSKLRSRAGGQLGLKMAENSLKRLLEL